MATEWRLHETSALSRSQRSLSCFCHARRSLDAKPRAAKNLKPRTLSCAAKGIYLTVVPASRSLTQKRAKRNPIAKTSIRPIHTNGRKAPKIASGRSWCSSRSNTIDNTQRARMRALTAWHTDAFPRLLLVATQSPLNRHTVATTVATVKHSSRH